MFCILLSPKLPQKWYIYNPEKMEKNTCFQTRPLARQGGNWSGFAALPALSLFLAGFAAAAPQLKHKLTIHFKAITIREYFKSTNDFWDKDLWWISCVVRSLPGHNQAALRGMISQPVGSI